MSSENEADGISFNGDCEIDDDTALSPMSSLLVPEIALSDGNFDEGNDDFDDPSGQMEEIVNVHTNGVRSYSCDVCDKVFKRKAHLRRHYRLHTGERPYECQWCGLKFARSEQRNQHVTREHNQSHITCTICGKYFHTDEERMNHMVLHLENRYFRCTICTKEFDKASALAGHMQVHTVHEPVSITKKSHKCQTCNMEFSRFDHLIRHQTVHSGVKMYQCQFCMKRFTRADNRTKHEKTCRIGKSSTSLDGEELNEQITIKTEPNQMDPLEIINVASIPEHYFDDIDTSNNTDDLLDNIDLFHDDTCDDGLPQIEEKTAVTAMEYVRMKQSEADNDLKQLGGIRQKVERPKLTKEEIDTLTCNVCGKTLAQKYHLVRHKIIHLKQKPYKCLKCSRSFARREHLRHHLFTHKRQSDKISQLQIDHKKNLRSTTRGSATIQKLPVKIEPNIPIASVSNSYKRDESLTENLRQQLLHRFKLFAIKLKQENNRENGDFYEQCFNFLGNLIMSNIQGVSKEMFSSNFVSTKRIVTPPSRPLNVPTLPTVTIKREDGNVFVKKFTCNSCNASFPSLRHLERHSVQHTGEKPHICEVCGNRFTRAEHKRRHMAIHTNSQNYECEICLKKFNRSDHMVAHFKVHHQGVKPYKCKFMCGERFDTFKEKLFHSRHCIFLPTATVSMVKDEEILPTSNESQEDVLMPEDPFANGQPELVDEPPFQSHFIKTEAEFPEENYDEMYGY